MQSYSRKVQGKKYEAITEHQEPVTELLVCAVQKFKVLLGLLFLSFYQITEAEGKHINKTDSKQEPRIQKIE